MLSIFRGKPNSSLGETNRVRGYEIKRMPIGAYLRALEQIQRIPGELLEVCFPGMSIQQIGSLMTEKSRDALEMVLVNMLDKAPRYLLDILSILLGIDADVLYDDPDIGLDGLVEMIDVWVDINGIANFTKAVKLLVAKVKAAARQEAKPMTEGSNG